LVFAEEKEATGWIRARRRAAMPPVLSGGPAGERSYAPRRLSEIRNERNFASVMVGPGKTSLIVFSRPWYPGYAATIDGRDVPVLRADLLMPAVELTPEQSGLLVVRYRPSSLILGLCIAIAGVLAAAAGVFVSARETDSTM
jgi:uncharacterized membrane protein YfhO